MTARITLSGLRISAATALAAFLAVSALLSAGLHAAPAELFFSEYIEGSSNNKALEIYNGTGAPINLTAGAYDVQMYFNGSSAAALTILLNGTVAAQTNVSVGFTPFDVCAQPYTTISSIQGSGPSTPMPGNVPLTTQGVVVGDFEGATGLRGFYLQDANGDGNDSTSDGIFVLTGSNTTNAGEHVRVTGFPRERFSQTTITGASNNTTPVPATDIVRCGTGGAPSPVDVMLPFPASHYPERFEGMLVRLPQPLVIAEYFNYERFGEMVLALPLDGETRPFTGTAIDAPGVLANARTLANSLRRITLDDGLGGQNPPFVRHPNGNAFALNNRFRGGDIVQNTVGVLGFDFDRYRIQPTGPADYIPVNPRTAAPGLLDGALKVAAMNTLNFFLTLDPQASQPTGPCGGLQNLECRGANVEQPLEFGRQRTKLLAALAGLDADIIGLNEIENTPGVEPLGDATRGIVPGLNDLQGAGTYDFIDTGVIGTDAIRVGIVYKPARVTPVGSFALLNSTIDPRFIDTRSRPSLAQTFEDNSTGARVTVVVNHLKSKGSACLPDDPDAGDGQGNCNITRSEAAKALVDWLATDPTGSGDADFLIVGDLNSYTKEDPVTAITTGSDDVAGTFDDFTNLIAKFQGAYAYSYVFDGQSGYLDHVLGSATLTPQSTGAEDWHINADEPDLLDYDTSFKPAEQDAIFEPNAYRTSDHDPVLVGLNPLFYPFGGFHKLVYDSPSFNMANGGSSIPLKFSLGSFIGLDIFAPGYPRSQPMACDATTPFETGEETVNPGDSALSYDATTSQYNYAWKTEKAWGGTCRQLIVVFRDGGVHRANMRFR